MTPIARRFTALGAAALLAIGAGLGLARASGARPRRP